MRYYYDQLNDNAKMIARLDYFDKYGTTQGMHIYLFRAVFTADGVIYEK